MANKFSYTVVGFTVVLGLVAILATLVYLGGLRGEEDLVYAETYTDKSVSGLSVGSVVNFLGVKVGEVKKIAFVGNEYPVSGLDAQRIYILMGLPSSGFARYAEDESHAEDRLKRLVEGGLRATVTASGITGLSHIELDLQPTTEPPPPNAWTPRNCFIPAGISLLDSFSDSATKVMNQINDMNLGAAWSNIYAAVQALAHASEGAKEMMATRQADLEKLTADLVETMSSVRELSNELKENPSLLVRERIPEPLPETAR